MKEGYLRLGDVCEVQNGFAFDSKFFSTNKESGIPLIRIRDILKGHSCTYYTSSYQEEYIVHKGDFLIGMDGDFNIGQWQSEDALLNQRVCRLLPSDKILPKFIFYFIPTALQRINAETSYATVKHLSSKQIKEILIPNISLTEQQRIVALLDAEFAKIDALKANAEKNLQNAKDLFQAALKKELEPKEGWRQYKLGDICTITSSKRIYKNEYVSEGIPFYRTKEVKEISNGRPITIELYISKERYTEIKEKFGVPQINDMLVSAVGTIGEIMIVKDEKPFYFKDGNLVWLKSITKTTPEYLRYYLLSEINRIKGMTYGAAYNALTIERFQEMEIGLASSEQVQNTIVARLDALSEKSKTLQENYEKTIALCDDLKQALLRKAFNGEI